MNNKIVQKYYNRNKIMHIMYLLGFPIEIEKRLYFILVLCLFDSVKGEIIDQPTLKMFPR